MAGGSSINLKGANHCILADQHWNPAIDEQAIDRIHRIGQEK
jgi:transcription termination factor 2